MRKHSNSNPAKTDTEFVTVPNMANRLGIKYHALLRAVNTGLVPSYKPFGDRRLVKPAEVIAFIERTRKGGAA
jgi:excisionase family DNA binding protein